MILLHKSSEKLRSVNTPEKKRGTFFAAEWGFELSVALPLQLYFCYTLLQSCLIWNVSVLSQISFVSNLLSKKCIQCCATELNFNWILNQYFMYKKNVCYSVAWKSSDKFLLREGPEINFCSIVYQINIVMYESTYYNL